MLGRTQVSRAALLCFLACLLLSVSPALFGQGARVSQPGVGEAADGDNQAAREAWFARGRTAPKGKTAAEMRWKAYQQKIQMRAAAIATARRAGANAASTAAPASAGWVALGPKPMVSNPGSGQDYGFVSGRATSVAIDPADKTGNTVYVGGAFGGLWRSQNAGSLSPSPGSVTWTPLIDTQGTLAVGAIAIQPNQAGTLSNNILVGTGEANLSGDSYWGLGILRSTDAGNTWGLITQDTLGNKFAGLAFSKIAYSTANPNLVVAGTGTSFPGLFQGARKGPELRGVYFSTNAGQTWTFETSVLDGSTPINPSNSVSTVVYNPAAGKFFAAFRFHGFYSSTDGAHWTRLTKQPASTAAGSLNDPAACPPAGNTACLMYRGEIAVVPGRNEMYAWYTDSGDGDQGIWRSLDGGATWSATQLNNTNIVNCGDPFGGCDTIQGSYDLELTAVPNPNGTATDVYAGARNIYKCTVSGVIASTTCQGTGASSFQNLTHVYGCSGHATVHPDQHALDFMVAGGKDVMYFANDGGVNRALDGFTGLTSANCFTNQFDSLNGTLGSMTEFVSFSQDPTNAAILLGGTQDNGSPAISSTGTQWHSVVGGDGGYNEIDPANPTHWFAANPPFTDSSGTRHNINIYDCTTGTSCLENNFNNLTFNSTIGGDIAPFYVFYMLDPQLTSKMVIGTDCRVWRGNSNASGFVALSDSFESPGAVPCNGGEVNHVVGIDAGGPTDSNGSKVMYATTEGTGPLAKTPAGGEVWRSVNASGGTNTWGNVTPPNPSHFSIAAVAVDLHDTTGNTAYAGLQGFNGLAGSGHVYKTINAGTSWTDFSTGLMDSPVNSLVVDSSVTPSVVYVGTDVGVFSSSGTAANFSEVGPAPSSGLSGYLPDAPVTRLRMFNSGGNRKLRASTYGRGIWEFVLAAGTPDYTFTPTSFTQTAYPGQTSQLNGTLTSVNSYSSLVNFSCVGIPPSPAPATCGGAAVTPTAPFTISASNATVGDFVFNIKAIGTDGAATTHLDPATLHVVDFNFSLNPASTTINVPQIGMVTIPIVPSANFSDSLQFSCPNQATAKVTCTFAPNPVPSGTTSTVLSIATAGASAISNFGLMVQANAVTNPAPAPKTQTLNLTLTAVPDYTLVIGTPAQTITVLTEPASFTGTLTSINGFVTPVLITCKGTLPANCAPPSSAVTPSPTGTAFTVTAKNNGTPGNFTFNISGTGGVTTHAQSVTLTENADFHITTTTSTATVTAGNPASYMIDFGPDGQNTFANAVTFTCSTPANLTTCSMSPNTLAAGTIAATVTMTVTTTAPVASLNPPPAPWKPSGPLFAFWLSLPAMGIVAVGAGRRKQNSRWLTMLGGGVLLLMVIGSLAGCSGSSHHSMPGTTPGTYTVTINATSGGVTHMATTQLTVQ